MQLSLLCWPIHRHCTLNWLSHCSGHTHASYSNCQLVAVDRRFWNGDRVVVVKIRLKKTKPTDPFTKKTQWKLRIENSEYANVHGCRFDRRPTTGTCVRARQHATGSRKGRHSPGILRRCTKKSFRTSMIGVFRALTDSIWCRWPAQNCRWGTHVYRPFDRSAPPEAYECEHARGVCTCSRGGGGGGGAIFDMIDAVTVFYSLVILVRSTDPRAWCCIPA